MLPETAPLPSWTVEVPALESDGVRLRAWRDDDGPRLVETALDDEFRAGIPHSPLPTTLDDVPEYLARVREGTAAGSRLPWCVADAETDLALGNVALFDFDDQPRGEQTAELGYWAHPAARGRGVMTTALRLVVRHAFDPDGLALRRLYVLTPLDSLASRRLVERIGFVQVGAERASSPVLGGGWRDTALYDLLREESGT
ncbi:GNAT family N-acetyltransferase [Nocardioides sp. GXZ039]|uniref:GNAT family N-acetyltransferase n=1 Tax=Nocardioides sp. GXZ039 TaxID=3136018 RepID=UPI0030F38475